MTVLPLAGRVAIVTGAGGGLGRSMARGLARAGARVVLTAARTWDELDAAAAEIAAERGEAAVTTMLADVADPDACEAVVALVLDRFGKLDLLVNNAGRGMKYVSESFMIEPPRFWEIPVETWQMVIATNVNGPFLMARARCLISSGPAGALWQRGGHKRINCSIELSIIDIRSCPVKPTIETHRPTPAAVQSRLPSHPASNSSFSKS